MRLRGDLLAASARLAGGGRLGRYRWVIERTFAWLNRCRRLTVRYQRRIDIHSAFTSIACSLIALWALEGRF